MKLTQLRILIAFGAISVGITKSAETEDSIGECALPRHVRVSYQLLSGTMVGTIDLPFIKDPREFRAEVMKAVYGDLFLHNTKFLRAQLVLGETIDSDGTVLQGGIRGDSLELNIITSACKIAGFSDWIFCPKSRAIEPPSDCDGLLYLNQAKNVHVIKPSDAVIDRDLNGTGLTRVGAVEHNWYEGFHFRI